MLPHAYRWSPCPWTGRWIRLQDSTNPDFLPHLMILLTSNNETIFRLLDAHVGGKMLFNHLRHSEILQVGILVVLSLMEVCDVLLRTPEVSLDRFFPNRRTKNSNLNVSRSSLTTTTSFFYRKCMERMDISKLFKCWLRGFGFFGTFHSKKRMFRRISSSHS